MGCCNARNCNAEEDFYTTGLNFVEVTKKKQYPPFNMDKIIYHHLKQHYKCQETNSQEGEDIEVNMTKFYRIDPETLKIFTDDPSWAFYIQQMLMQTLIKYRHSIMNTFKKHPDTLAPIESQEQKSMLIGKKYSKQEAIT